MKQTPINIMPLFASPLATTELADAEQLNNELEALLLQCETEQHRNPNPTHIAQAEVFESDFDLFRWQQPCIRTLRQFVLENVASVVAQLSGYSPETIRRFKILNHTWFHITRYGGSFVAHNHPMASWSAVYCVRAGEEVPERRSSGVLRFLDHRPGSNMFIDPANANIAVPYNFGHYSVRLKAGQLVIFPSYLVHEVATFLGRDQRITIASNCWFVQQN